MTPDDWYARLLRERWAPVPGTARARHEQGRDWWTDLMREQIKPPQPEAIRKEKNAA